MRWKPAISAGSIFLLLMILMHRTLLPSSDSQSMGYASLGVSQAMREQNVAAPLAFAPFASERLTLCNRSGSGSAIARLPADWLPECPPMPLQADESDSTRERRSSFIREKYKNFTKKCEKNKGMMWLRMPREGHDVLYDNVTDAFLRRRKPPTPEQPIRVLDWGSGCGAGLRYLHDKFAPGAFYGLGIDLIEEAVDYARPKYQTPETRYCNGDGTQLQWLPNSSFDLVVSFAATPHIPSRFICSTMSHLLRILKPGGMIWLGFFYVQSSLKLHQQCRPECGADHVQRFIVREREWLGDAPIGMYRSFNATSIIFIKPTEAEAQLSLYKK